MPPFFVSVIRRRFDEMAASAPMPTLDGIWGSLASGVFTEDAKGKNVALLDGLVLTAWIKPARTTTPVPRKLHPASNPAPPRQNPAARAATPQWCAG
ncbi:hypothetical protein ACI2TX_11155 [Ralstonia nicotianae]